MAQSSLLARVHRLIDATYDLDSSGIDPAVYIVGDAGVARLVDTLPPGEDRPRAMVLVRTVGDAHRVTLYYPDALIRNLERNDPRCGLSEENLHDFATFVEELDHLLVLVTSGARGRPVSGLELELHANVTKILVVSLFLARTLGVGELTLRQRHALRHELLGRGDYAREPPELRQRYRDARRHGLRFLRRLEATPPPRRPQLLRRFSRAPLGEKLRLA